MAKKLSVPLDDADARFIEELARSDDRSVAQTLRRLIRAARTASEGARAA